MSRVGSGSGGFHLQLIVFLFCWIQLIPCTQTSSLDPKTPLSSSAPPSNNKITNLSEDVNCGRQLARRPKIVGGMDAYPGEFPWLVSIKEVTMTASGQQPSGLTHMCGGSILNNQFILSAAHCFENFHVGGRAVRLDKLRVSVGEHDFARRQGAQSFQLTVEKLIMHPGFDSYGYLNDIALLKLSDPIHWSPFSWPACVEMDPGFEAALPGTNATVAGWGSTVDITPETPGEYPKLLQRTVVPILSNSECSEWFQRQGVHWSPTQSHLCAGYAEGGMDACRGDSGGPLMVPLDEDRLVVVGIVAAGKGCARPSLPGVYTRTSPYIPWIQAVIRTHG